MTIGAPADAIRVVAPSPSILTAATDRSGAAFGITPPLSVEGQDPERTLAAGWRGGISWQSFGCQRSYPWRVCDDDQEDKALSDYGGPVTSSPFVIYTPLECEWAGAEETLAPAAVALNEAQTAYGMARALWMGEGLPDAVSQPTLRNTATDLGFTGDLDDVVARLLGAYETGTYGLGGAVLHIPSILMTGALGGLPGGGKVATQEGNMYRGPLGSVISPGPGYPWGASDDGDDGFGPYVAAGSPAFYEGSAADEVWIYVSGPVEYALGPPKVNPDAQSASALRRNSAEVIAERMAIFRFEPCSVWAAKAFNTTTTSQTQETS